jgi:hypothetical protein
LSPQQEATIQVFHSFIESQPVSQSDIQSVTMVPMKRAAAHRNPSRPAVTGLKSPKTLLNAAANENSGIVPVSKPNSFVNARKFSSILSNLVFLVLSHPKRPFAIIFHLLINLSALAS